MAPWGIFALILLAGLVLLALAVWAERRGEDATNPHTTSARGRPGPADASSGEEMAGPAATGGPSDASPSHRGRRVFGRRQDPDMGTAVSHQAQANSTGGGHGVISDLPPTYYVLEDLARQAPDLLPVSEELRQAVQEQLGASTTCTSTATLLDAVFETHVDRHAIVDDPLVLVCAEPVRTDRELIPVLRTAAGLKRPVVIAAPAFDPSSQQLLAANQLAGTVRAVPLVGTQAVLAELASVTGCTWVERADLQAGYLPASVWGRTGRVVADARGTSLVPTSTDDDDPTADTPGQRAGSEA